MGIRLGIELLLIKPPPSNVMKESPRRPESGVLVVLERGETGGVASRSEWNVPPRSPERGVSTTATISPRLAEAAGPSSSSSSPSSWNVPPRRPVSGLSKPLAVESPLAVRDSDLRGLLPAAVRESWWPTLERDLWRGGARAGPWVRMEGRGGWKSSGSGADARAGGGSALSIDQIVSSGGEGMDRRVRLVRSLRLVRAVGRSSGGVLMLPDLELWVLACDVLRALAPVPSPSSSVRWKVPPRNPSREDPTSLLSHSGVRLVTSLIERAWRGMGSAAGSAQARGSSDRLPRGSLKPPPSCSSKWKVPPRSPVRSEPPASPPPSPSKWKVPPRSPVRSEPPAEGGGFTARTCMGRGRSRDVKPPPYTLPMSTLSGGVAEPVVERWAGGG
mmetsp:Transcript_54519/g.173230  ORF Transcript_54519/g.173230 Transcript_54519/m.173230 type:complete len:388 (-) Transcript_54519:323-1486(-)